MNVHEWPLTLFTILAQMSVGAFVTLGVVNVFGRTKYSAKTIDRLGNPALYAIGPIMVLALIASIFHLGNPLNAPNAFRHVASSWLSREILFGVGFAALGFLFALAQWFNWFNATIRTVLATITAVWGLVFVWVMAHVYLLPTVPAWNHWTTPASFYLSAGLTGSLAIAVAFSSWPTISNKWPKLDKSLNKTSSSNSAAKAREDVTTMRQTTELTNTVVKWVGITTVVLLTLQLAVIICAQMIPATTNPPATQFSTTWFITRIVLLIIGAGLMGLYLTLSSQQNALTKKTRSLMTLAITSFILVTASEIIARFLFYGAMNRIGI